MSNVPPNPHSKPHNKSYKHGRGSHDEQHQADQALFHQLLKQHQHLKRVTQQIDNGIIATTTTEDPQLAEVLQVHVKGMETRFKNNRAIRSWDPLFIALFEYKDQISMTYRHLEKGIEAKLTSDNPKIIELIQAHDLTLHGFVNEGFKAARAESPKPSWLE